jgi:uncharacterized protein YecE (DUF72 family)
MRINVGTAGWSIARQNAGEFPADGSSLERYAERFPVAEINSSFHRPHRASTWERWRDSVPPTFRFSVKLPKTITHDAKLSDCSALLDEFLKQTEVLGDKLGVLLVQLPPKLEFDADVTGAFFAQLRSRTKADLACEPRNGSWFCSEADALLEHYQVARVAADPARFDAAALPGGWPGLRYWRLHGSPVMYRSSYSDRMDRYARLLDEFAGGATESWCIFDNTASSAATGDALALADAVAAAAAASAASVG